MQLFRPSHWLRSLEIRREIHRASVAALDDPTLPDLVDVVDGKAVWQVRTATGDVYMSDRSGEIDDEFFVVQCHAERFYLAWLRSGLPLLRSEMPTDYKFHYAVRGFTGGRENPVPLAFVTVNTWEGKPTMAFINGITRSYWLLANQAPSFPVRVHGQRDAEELHRLAGLGDRPMSFEEIFASNATMRP